MAFTNNPSTNRNDRIRLLVGDVSTSNTYVYLTDNSYTYFGSLSANDFTAAMNACNSLAAFFMGKGSEKKVGDMLLRREMAKEFRQLAVQYKTMAAKGMSAYAGGISRSDKRAANQDLDRVKPAFTRSEFDNRYALDPQQSTST